MASTLESAKNSVQSDLHFFFLFFGVNVSFQKIWRNFLIWTFTVVTPKVSLEQLAAQNNSNSFWAFCIVTSMYGHTSSSHNCHNSGWITVVCKSVDGYNWFGWLFINQWKLLCMFISSLFVCLFKRQTRQTYIKQFAIQFIQGVATFVWKCGGKEFHCFSLCLCIILVEF